MSTQALNGHANLLSQIMRQAKHNTPTPRARILKRDYQVNLKSALVLARGPVLASSFARNTTVSGGLQPGDVPGSP